MTAKYDYAMRVQAVIKEAIDEYETLFNPTSFSLEAHIYWKLKVKEVIEEPKETNE